MSLGPGLGMGWVWVWCGCTNLNPHPHPHSTHTCNPSGLPKPVHIPSRIHVFCNAMPIYAHVQRACPAFWHAQLFVDHLTGLTSELNSFAVSQHVLTVFLTSVAVYMLLQMPGMSLCLLDASDKFPKPSGPATPRLESPTFNFASVPSLSLVLLVFYTVEVISRVLIFSLDVSTCTKIYIII